MEGTQELDIIITLITGTLVVLIMAAVIISSVIKYQKNVLKQRTIFEESEKRFQTELLDATIVASEKERESVAKNIHDDVGVLTNVIKLNNSQLKNKLKNDSGIFELIKANDQLLLEINESIRAISNDLASPTLMQLGFFKAVRQLCSVLPNTIKVQLNCEVDTVRLDKKTEIQLFRTCKEVLTNIIKHSGASEINIFIALKDEEVIVIVSYNGNGISDDEVRTIIKTSKGLGLKSIYGRLQIMNGKISYIRSAGSNEIKLNVPVTVYSNA
jgi:signal transduction histidine kinase